MPGERVAGRRTSLGQHFFASAEVASRFVADARVEATDCVVEFGAGDGVLTAALAARAAVVIAIEIDSRLARRLVQRFASTPNVVVWTSDARAMPLPASGYRIVANLPFAITNATLHSLLDDPRGGLTRADLVVQWQVARERVRVQESAAGDLIGALWAPWWEFARGRRLPSRCFTPPPRVDAAVLRVVRRDPPLLAPDCVARFHAFVRRTFANDSQRARSQGLEDWLRAARRIGCAP